MPNILLTLLSEFHISKKETVFFSHPPTRRWVLTWLFLFPPLEFCPRTKKEDKLKQWRENETALTFIQN